MRDEVVRRRRKRRSWGVRALALGVFLLGTWVLSANTILRPYLTPGPSAERIASVDEGAALPDASAVLPVVTAPAMTRLAAATPSGAEPSQITEALSIVAEKTEQPVFTASHVTPVRLASAAPTVGGADISDAAVIAKAIEPGAETPARAMPAPRTRPRIAAVPLPRPRPHRAHAAPVSFLDRLFGSR